LSIKQFVLLHNFFPIYIRSYEEAAGGLWRVLAHGVAAERGDDRHADQTEGGKCNALCCQHLLLF